jgi:YesN/AraC family two-component response regulator
VDDEIDIRKILSSSLGKRYKILEAENGREVIDKLSNNNIDIVILDIMLPDISGLQILKYIKTFHPNIPVLVLTAYSCEDLVIKCLRLGARDYFKKPFNIEEICEKIDLLLNNRAYKGVERRKKRENIFLILRKDIEPKEIKKKIQNKEFTPHIKKAIKYIKENFDNNELTLSKVAKEACLSQYHFSRIFKEISGVSYTNFLNGIRISKAKKLLRDKTASILDISLSVGFNNLSHFDRVFKKREGMTPTEYRRRLS